MKKVKLMALGLMVMMIQSVGAVTLPTTSYSPYYVSDDYSSSDGSIVVPGGTLVNGSFSTLGAGSYELCQNAGEAKCASCCEENYTSSCIDNCLLLHPGEYDYCEETACGPTQKACVNECMNGTSMPLDGGLSILLALAIGSGAVRAFKRKK